MVRPRLPSLNWLRVFEAAARSESFARAAEQLGLSPPAVSQQIRALETQLGATLFRRHAHAVTLTEAGRAYLPSVQQALLSLENSTTGLFGQAREQPLYVRSVLLFAHGVLAPAMAGFRQRHPDIALNLTTGDTPAEFGQGFSDMQIIFGNPTAYGAESDRLIGETLFPVALPGIAAEIHEPADLLAHPLIEITMHRAGWPHLFEATRTLGAGARFLIADSTVMATTLAAQGCGIALARSPASDLAVAMSGLVPCLPGLTVPGREAYHLVYPDRSALRPPARSFRDWLLALARNPLPSSNIPAGGTDP